MRRRLHPKVTVERLREVLDYDQVSGIFTWRIRRSGTTAPGTTAGTINKADGYVRISIDGTTYLAHLLAWLHVHGVWPDDELDHRDTVRHHNWLDNLRPATSGENGQNKTRARKGSKSGVLGVSWEASCRKWRADIMVDGKHKFLGFDANKEVCAAMYQAAKESLHPFYASAK